jgi:hypothetical protein
MGAYQGGGWDRIDCPHEANDLIEFSSLFPVATLVNGTNVNIASGINNYQLSILSFPCLPPRAVYNDNQPSLTLN